MGALVGVLANIPIVYKMATNSKSINKPTYLRRLVALAVVGFVISFYIWSKICQVIRDSHSGTESEDGWWISKTFSSDTSSSLSFTEKQFYLALLLAIQDDFSWATAGIDWIDWPVALVVLSSIFLASLFAYVFFMKTQTKQEPEKEPDKDEIKKEHSYQTRSQSGGAGPRNNRKGGQGQDTAKKVPSWKGFGWGYRHYWRLTIGIMFLAFLMSIPWEYVRLYQTMVAEKVTQITTGIPAECVPDQMSMTQSLKSWLRWHFSWSSDPCLRYHKALLVDPMWQVPPLMVITSALSHCLVYPVEVFCDRLGNAFRLFFSEIPTPWQPLMFVVTVLLSVLFLIMLFGYRIRSPLLTIEPRKSLSSYLSTRTKKNIVEELVANKADTSVDSSLDYSIMSSQATELGSTQPSQSIGYK